MTHKFDHLHEDDAAHREAITAWLDRFERESEGRIQKTTAPDGHVVTFYYLGNADNGSAFVIGIHSRGTYTLKQWDQ